MKQIKSLQQRMPQCKTSPPAQQSQSLGPAVDWCGPMYICVGDGGTMDGMSNTMIDSGMSLMEMTNSHDVH